MTTRTPAATARMLHAHAQSADCPVCLTYWRRRGRVINRAIGLRAHFDRTEVSHIRGRFLEGLHARHLAGHPLIWMSPGGGLGGLESRSTPRPVAVHSTSSSP